MISFGIIVCFCAPAASLLALVGGGASRGLVAGTHSAAANAHLLIISTHMLSLVEAAPLGYLTAQPPPSGLLPLLQARGRSSIGTNC